MDKIKCFPVDQGYKGRICLYHGDNGASGGRQSLRYWGTIRARRRDMAASCASKNSDGLQAYHRAVEYGAHRAKARHNDVAADNGGPWAAFSKLGGVAENLGRSENGAAGKAFPVFSYHAETGAGAALMAFRCRYERLGVRVVGICCSASRFRVSVSFLPVEAAACRSQVSS